MNMKTIVTENIDVPNIIDADKFVAMTLDDISIKLDKLITLNISNQKLLSHLIEQTIENGKNLKNIYKELSSGADEAGVLRSNGIVTTTQFIIIDTMKNPGHMIKGYTVRNDGPNNIFVAHNAAFSSDVDADIIDTVSNDSRFELVLPNEDIKFSFNRNNILNIHILAQNGDSTYRAWLVW